jgi:hypothetical protein
MTAYRPYPVILATLLLAVSLTACGRADNDPAAGGMTVGEAERLEAAAERLDARPPSPVSGDSQAFERETAEQVEAEKGRNSAR